MAWVNLDDVFDQLVAAGLAVGSTGDVQVDTTKPVRTRVEGGDREKRGWYWLMTKEVEGEQYVVGACGIYDGTDNGKISIRLNRDGKALKLSKDEREAIAARQRANQKRLKSMRKAEVERCSRRATQVWKAYSQQGDSDYLRKKGVGAHGVRFAPQADTIAVPMQDRSGKVWGLQLIRGADRPTGKLAKEYWPKGLDKKGHYHLVGGFPRGVVLVAEGYATAATLHEATGLPCAVAFDAGNLMPVALAVSQAYPGAWVLVCADDDYMQRCKHCKHLTPVEDPTCQHCGQAHERENPGLRFAKDAALAVSGSVVAPAWEEPRPTDKKGPTDFNDLAALEGNQRVSALVMEAIEDAGRMDLLRHSAREPARGVEGERGDIPSMLSVEDALDRFYLIYGGKGTMFDAVEHMLVPKSDVLDLLPDHGWRDMRARKKVARIDEVGFDPTGSDKRIKCNLWGGWPTKPAPGSCERLLELLEYLCSGDSETQQQELSEWVLKWLAMPLQKPGAKMRTSLVFHGPQGTGKNLFFEAYMNIYGDYGRIIDQAALEDKFNDWASRKLFLIADEVVARQELYHVKNKLKSFITGEWIRVNAKNVAAHDERNHVNLVFLSNESQPLVLEKDDRRYTVIWTPRNLPQAIYDEVSQEIAAGGIEALHHHLLNLDMGDFNEHTKPPMTHAKRQLIEISMDSVERFVLEWMAGDVQLVVDGPGLPFCPCASSDLYTAYQRWCRAQGVAKPREQNQFLGRVMRREGWKKGHKDRYECLHSTRTRRQRFVMPSDADMIEAGRHGHTDRRQPADKNQTTWLTECYLEFNEAMGSAE